MYKKHTRNPAVFEFSPEKYLLILCSRYLRIEGCVVFQGKFIATDKALL